MSEEENLNTCITKLVTIILTSWKEKVRKAQEEKLDKCVIFEYKDREKLQDTNEDIYYLISKSKDDWDVESVFKRLHIEIYGKGYKIILRFTVYETDKIKTSIEITWVDKYKEQELNMQECLICFDVFDDLVMLHDEMYEENYHECCKNVYLIYN